MQFLVYLTVLMVAISTVLLEVHWLTSPAPQPKPTIQAGARPPPPKVEGPSAALSPIYPPTSRTPVASRWASSSLAGALAGSAIYMPFCGALARNS